MDERFPVNGVSIDEGAQTGAGIFHKVSPLPGLEPEMHRGESKMRCDGNFIAEICAHSDATVREDEGVALGGAEFSHERKG